MQIFLSFYEGQLKQQICYSFALLISYIHGWFLINYKWQPSSLRINQVYPTSFFPNFTGPWPQIMKGRKIPVLIYLDLCEKPSNLGLHFLPMHCYILKDK